MGGNTIAHGLMANSHALGGLAASTYLCMTPDNFLANQAYVNGLNVSAQYLASIPASNYLCMTPDNQAINQSYVNALNVTDRTSVG